MPKRKPVSVKAWALVQGSRVVRSRGQLAPVLVIFGAKKDAIAEIAGDPEIRPVRVSVKEIRK